MKKISVFWAILALVMAVGLAGQAAAVDVAIHGDFNNRFNLYTNQSQMYKGGETETKQPVRSDDNSAFWGDIKYRLWTELGTNDGKIKGVYAIELGALRFGQSDYSKGGGGTYSGDGVNIETRWAYTDFQLPFVDSKARVQVGLIPFDVNHYVWQETVMGAQLLGSTNGFDYKMAWVRGYEVFPGDTNKNAFQDADAILLRGDITPMEGWKTGLFFLYQRMDGFDGINDKRLAESAYEIKYFGKDEYSLYTVGLDGKYTSKTGFGNAFLNYDLIYQGGNINQPGDQDVSAYFLHGDLGVNIDRLRLTYTTWYASGDDNPNDGTKHNFMATDVDINDSIIFFEGGLTDDNYFTEKQYIMDKGMYLNKLGADYKFTDKTTAGLAVLYLMTAEDLANGSKNLGTEIDAYISYKLFSNTELKLNYGYLFSDDGMDNFVGGIDKGKGAEDIYRSTMWIRYMF
ncbi:hypothetical protein [Desulfatirhabdium butyrativorans]|uniref:hypothetical protein n=1 Tax=Desulfatirhabdium butyrativorans TaxID=340467 RepID=UPI0004062821|nr:hypothetical protein [Desulfatirhabdium butyrativorans]